MKDLIHALSHELIVDVFVSGYIDSASPARFHPMYERLFFVFEKCTFELFVSDSGWIDVRALGDIEVWFDMDEDDAFSLMSVYNQFFKTEQDVVVVSVSSPSGPFETLTIKYREGLAERDVCLNPNHFFGFSFL
ncbi:hypothetical protein [Corticimicrobacter populi]|uniref:Uncharacterized protein n=1 Tax=Corticimicrobacter populi TaxID=2175229 RepID=A0A2V1K0I4_9BURK|nr:hypothetical protein [Corticimicrobacter populi]PWF24706.1 hypothetical protein DD235_00460 [Corticimicrobacter populi]